MRRAAKSDTTQGEIVNALRLMGYTVVIIRWPTDILVRSPHWFANTWILAECKTRNRKDGYAPDPRQKEQIKFCADNEVPYWTSIDDAIRYLEEYEVMRRAA